MYMYVPQARGEVLMVSPPGAKESKAEAPEVPAAAVTQPSDDPMDEDTKTDTATGTPAGETLATGDDSVNTDGDAPAANEDGGASAEADQKSGKDSEVASEEANGVESKTTVTEEEAQNKEGAVPSNGESRVESERPKDDVGVEADVEVYRRDMRWLRTAHGMVAEVSTPSLGVGYKIALMIHQRCKPCLCLFNKNKGRVEGDTATVSVLPHMLTGDKNLDIHEYSNVSEIDAIVAAWIEKQFPNKGPNSRRTRGGRGDSRDRSGRKRANEEGRGGGRDKGGRDGEKEAEKGASSRRRSNSNNDDDEDNNDRQSVTEGVGGDGDIGSGERTESVISDDDGNNDEHEEVEDATGVYAAGAATAGSDADGDGIGNGAVGDDDGDLVSNDGSVQ
ncbi:unnamed protein product [Ectocarpus fasciculatus]